MAYKGFVDGFTPESATTVIVRQSGKKQDRVLLPYRSNKRNMARAWCCGCKRKSEETGGPLSLRSIQDGEDFDLLIAALARDQATIVDTVESVFHIPSKLSTSNGIEAYDYEVKYAEKFQVVWGGLLMNTGRNLMGAGKDGLKVLVPQR